MGPLGEKKHRSDHAFWFASRRNGRALFVDTAVRTVDLWLSERWSALLQEHPALHMVRVRKLVEQRAARYLVRLAESF